MTKRSRNVHRPGDNHKQWVSLLSSPYGILKCSIFKSYLRFFIPKRVGTDRSLSQTPYKKFMYISLGRGTDNLVLETYTSNQNFCREGRRSIKITRRVESWW